MAVSSYEIPDPGTGNAITYNRWGQVVPLTIAAAAAETNTLAAPLNANQRIIIFAQSVGAAGVRTITVASAFNGPGDTTLVFDALDDYCILTSVPVGSGVFEWRIEASEGLIDGTLAIGAGTGITAGTGTIYKNSVERNGGIYKTSILIDLTGLASSTTDLDIIGVGAGAAYIAKLSAGVNGTTILAVKMTCLELPAGGADDIDLYSATEATGVFDAAISTLAETALLTSGGAWANGTVKAATVVPLASEYLYLTGGEAGTAATYTAGKFLIEIFGYD